MKEKQPPGRQTKLGLQGTVLGFLDPWAGEASDRLMRTGTGMVYPSQDPKPDREEFVSQMKRLGADFYVHHVFPDGEGLTGHSELLEDMVRYDMEVCLGNEYGNINGPWVDGTNRYDVTDGPLLEVARTGKLIGLLYDEPEHLQINAGQYRKDRWLPHWGSMTGLTLEASAERMASVIAQRVEHVEKLLSPLDTTPKSGALISEQVFPTLFHVAARGGMTLCPKVMKESFQPLQLSTALGAAKQYGRDLWICADLWGPDIGHWFTRVSGFPGHSPEEFASALRMGYYMGPTHLFTENVDALMTYGPKGFELTEFGEVWKAFALDFVPKHPLSYDHKQASADIALVCSDDSNYGQHARLFGSREQEAPLSTSKLFEAWHLLSHGTIPAHGSCMHIPGYDFPRHKLKAAVPREAFPLTQGLPEPLLPEGLHPLFYPSNNVLVYDEFVTEEALGEPKLILLVGSRVPAKTLQLLRRKAEQGAAVIADKSLVPAEWKESRKLGSGSWTVTSSFLSEEAREAANPHLGDATCWRQCFGSAEVRMYKGDADGFTLDFELARK
ncbi:hypothetical protein [Paenibacillus silviterrae]|uniref:hypothetical protein n=1 Tax=Paenibacillus silviterrae TaxID=3242194 RepID=UPI002542BEC1|nr:hypothetical protein [Paenibacillus chinjuensis]